MYNISRFTITIDNPKFQHWFNNMFNLMNDYRTQQNKNNNKFEYVSVMVGLYHCPQKGAPSLREVRCWTGAAETSCASRC